MMSQLRPWLFSGWYRVWGRTLWLLLLLNAAFIGVLFLSTFMPTDVIKERIRQAFATGELGETDYLPYDTRRGFHQYNDCNILQMMTNSDGSRVNQALGPWLYLADDSATEVCQTLRELVVDGRDPAPLIGSRYTRYWHGAIPVIRLLLMVVEIGTVRMLLRLLVTAAVVLLLVAAAHEKRFLFLTAPITVAGLFFWGLLYFGQGMSHALGDTVVMLGLAALVFWHRALAWPEKLLPFCALFGAAVLYWEMLTGPLPIAAGFLFPTVYLLSRLTRHDDVSVGAHFRLAVMALLTFVLGAVFTLGLKVVLAAALIQPHGLDTMAGNLSLYTQPVESTNFVPGFVRPFGRLLRRGTVLSYGTGWGLAVLYLTVALSWLAAAWLAWRRASYVGWGDFLAFFIGAASIPVWTVLLQTHTFMHADFMTRMLIVPIALGWAVVLWQRIGYDSASS